MSEDFSKNTILNAGSDNGSDYRQSNKDEDISVIIQKLAESDDVSDLDLPLVWKPLQDRIHSLSLGIGVESVKNGQSFFSIQNSTYPLAIQTQNGIEASNSTFKKLFGISAGSTETISFPSSYGADYQKEIVTASDGSERVLSRFPLCDGNKTSFLLALSPKDTMPDNEDKVFFALPDPALILNKNGIIVRVNPAFLTISGKKTGELLYHDLTAARLDEDLGDQLKTVLSARIPYTTSTRYTGTDGLTAQKKIFLTPISVLQDQVDQVLLILKEDPLSVDNSFDKRNEYNSLKNKYTDLISHLPVALADIDGSGRVNTVNNNFAEILGVSSDSLLFKQMNTLVPDLIYETTPDHLLHGDDCITREGPLYSPTFHGTVQVQAIRKPDGYESDYGMFLFLTKKLHETELLPIPSQIEPTKNKDGICELLLGNTPVPVALIQTDGKFSYMNESFRSLLRLGPKDSTAVTAQEYGLIPVSVSDLRKTGETGATWCNHIYCDVTGKEVHVNVTYIPLSFNMAPDLGIVIVSPGEDKTCMQQQGLHTQTEFSLFDHKENWLNQLIASYPDPALICDPDGFIRFGNRVFADFIGIPADRTQGLQLQDYVIRLQEGEFSFPRSDTGSPFKNVRITGKDKDRFFCQCTIPVPSSDQKGDIILYFDITQEIDTIRSLSDETKTLHGTVASLNETITSVHYAGNTGMGNEISGTGTYEILEFTIQDSWFAIDVEMVKEIVEMVTITPLPKTPSYICGVINLRGEIITIIDLSILIGSTSQKRRDEQKIIVLSSDKTERVNLGLIVDEVNSVQLVENEQFNKLGDDITAHTTTGIKGIIRLGTDDRDSVESVEGGKRLIIWLKMENIIDEIRLHS